MYRVMVSSRINKEMLIENPRKKKKKKKKNDSLQRLDKPRLRIIFRRKPSYYMFIIHANCFCCF